MLRIQPILKGAAVVAALIILAGSAPPNTAIGAWARSLYDNWTGMAS